MNPTAAQSPTPRSTAPASPINAESGSRHHDPRLSGALPEAVEPRLNRPVFALSALIIVGVSLAAILNPDAVQSAFDAAVAWTGRWFGWFYVLLTTAALVLLGVLAVTRFGSIRLGPDNSTPDFSTFSWAAMLFAAGIGTGIMFYAIAEPVAQYIAPPTGQGETVEAARNAVTWTLFHYGISGWGLYGVVGIALGYFSYRKRDRLAVRSTLRPLLGSRVDGVLGDIVDVFALVGGVFGIAASLGIGVVQLNVGLTLLFGVEQGIAAQIGLVSLAVLMATVSAVSGVDRGVRILSNINVLLAMGLALWVLITGNTAFLLDALVANIGDFLTRFPVLTLETFPYDRPDAWLNGWTLFFWAWWITWAAFVGMFLARISRGRTIRQFVIGALVLPFSYVLMWVSIFGNTALDLIRSGDAEFEKIAYATPEGGLYALLDSLPLGGAFIALALFVGVLFYVTSSDSGSLVMANLSTRDLPDRRDAAPWLRIFWAAATGALTIAMLLAGGIPILQQATIVMALPFSFVLILIAASLWKALRSEATRAAARTRALTSGLIAMSGTAAGRVRLSWRDRLSRTFDAVSPARAKRALDTRVVPALDAVAEALRSEGLIAEVVVEGPEAEDPDDEREFLGRASLAVSASPEVLEQLVARLLDVPLGGAPVDAEAFRYTVRMVVSPVPAFGVSMPEDDDTTVRLEVRPRGGGQGYDVMNWTSDQVAHDVLDHFERWIDYLGVAGAAR